jgi:hypothetical protein
MDVAVALAIAFLSAEDSAQDATFCKTMDALKLKIGIFVCIVGLKEKDTSLVGSEVGRDFGCEVGWIVGCATG